MKLNPSPCVSRRQAAFTLIELLVVIAIIAILAALLLQVAGMVQEKAARARAQVEIQGLSSAIESYKLDNGTYPTAVGGGDVVAEKTSDSDTSTGVLITELVKNRITANQKPSEAITIKMLGGYRAGMKYDDAITASTYLVDPFGNSYHYQFKGDKDQSGEAFYDLWSEGKDGATRNSALPAKWIKNW